MEGDGGKRTRWMGGLPVDWRRNLHVQGFGKCEAQPIKEQRVGGRSSLEGRSPTGVSLYIS